MSKLNLRTLVPLESIASPLEPRVPMALSPDLPDALRDWRTCRLDDDPGAALAHLIKMAVHSVPGGLLDVDEARQEAWVVSLSSKAISGVDCDPLALPPRLIVILRNHLADRQRRARRRQMKSLTIELADARIGREEDPAVAYERGRIRVLVREILDEARERLSETSHLIIVLRGIDERSFEEIAELIAWPVARVRDRHRRAMAHLRLLFLQRLADDPADFRLMGCPSNHPISNSSEVKS